MGNIETGMASAIRSHSFCQIYFRTDLIFFSSVESTLNLSNFGGGGRGVVSAERSKKRRVWKRNLDTGTNNVSKRVTKKATADGGSSREILASMLI